MDPITLAPIGIVHSPYREKFAIPRQPGLVTAARATLELSPEYGNADSVRGLEQFSHLWLVFLFHQHLDRGWQPLVRPPRLGGNRKIGIFATRSTFRPNPIGLSVVKLEQVTQQAGKTRLELSGIDLLDGTPVLDIKPYIPYADSLPEASGGFAEDSPTPPLQVGFAPAAAQACHHCQARYPGLQQLISQVLAQDPRPAYRRGEQVDRIYGVQLYDLNIRFRIEGEHCTVVSIEPLA